MAVEVRDSPPDLESVNLTLFVLVVFGQLSIDVHTFQLDLVRGQFVTVVEDICLGFDLFD